MRICTELGAFTVFSVIVKNGRPDTLRPHTRFSPSIGSQEGLYRLFVLVLEGVVFHRSSMGHAILAKVCFI